MTTPAAAYTSTADFIDAEILRPHRTEITGSMLMDAERWYGVPVRCLLVVMGAETSLGDPRLGGALVRYHNYGCIRAFGDYRSKPWGKLANGTVTVAGKEWLTFPDMQRGVMAEGRLLKKGANGAYLRALTQQPPDWRTFARTYYGANVMGLESYIANLNRLDKAFVARAAKAGFSW